MAGIPDEQFLVDADDKKKGVLLSMERYEQLTEDLHDLAVVVERREEEPISFDVMLQGSKKMASFRASMPAKAKELHKAATKLGFQMVRQNGCHARWKHPDGRVTTIPIHGKCEIGNWLSTKF